MAHMAHVTDKVQMDLLIEAARRGHLEVLQGFLHPKIRIVPEALGWAAWNGHQAVVKLLLDYGADIHAGDKYGTLELPLLAAIHQRNTEMVRLLLDRGADPSRTDGKALDEALFNCHIESLEFLLRPEPEPEPEKFGWNFSPAQYSSTKMSISDPWGTFDGRTGLIVVPYPGHPDPEIDYWRRGPNEEDCIQTIRWLLKPQNYGRKVALIKRTDLDRVYPKLMGKIKRIEQEELYNDARVMYYALSFARQQGYSNGGCGSLVQALNMNLSG